MTPPHSWHQEIMQTTILCYKQSFNTSESATAVSVSHCSFLVQQLSHRILMPVHESQPTLMQMIWACTLCGSGEQQHIMHSGTELSTKTTTPTRTKGKGYNPAGNSGPMQSSYSLLRCAQSWRAAGQSSNSLSSVSGKVSHSASTGYTRLQTPWRSTY
jgi:hypothetical protein